MDGWAPLAAAIGASCAALVAMRSRARRRHALESAQPVFYGAGAKEGPGGGCGLSLREAFSDHGYIIVRGLLGKDEVGAVRRAIVDGLLPSLPPPPSTLARAGASGAGAAPAGVVPREHVFYEDPSDASVRSTW